MLLILLFFIAGAASQCQTGCTLSQGYWKTHHGSANAGSTRIPWPVSEDTAFLDTDKSWLEMLKTPSVGDACIIFAKEFIAAKLNLALGTCPIQRVSAALEEGENHLRQWCSKNGRRLRDANEARDYAVTMSTILEQFNTGVTGPGKCNNQCGDILLTTQKNTNTRATRGRDCNIVPMVSCMAPRENGMCEAFWSYSNQEGRTLFVPRNKDAQLSNIISGAVPQIQPVFFVAGRKDNVFSTLRNCSSTPTQTWTLAKNSATSTPTTVPRCPVGCDGIPYSPKVMDACGICGGPNTNIRPGDCNGNGINDFCGIQRGLEKDENHNGIVDECEEGTPPPPPTTTEYHDTRIPVTEKPLPTIPTVDDNGEARGSCCLRGQCLDALTEDEAQESRCSSFVVGVFCSQRDQCVEKQAGDTVLDVPGLPTAPAEPPPLGESKISKKSGEFLGTVIPIAVLGGLAFMLFCVYLSCLFIKDDEVKTEQQLPTTRQPTNPARTMRTRIVAADAVKNE